MERMIVANLLPEADAIQMAREVLKGAERRLTSSSLEDNDAVYLGRLLEAIDNANDALFRIINVAHSYLDDVNSAEVFDRLFPQSVRKETENA